MKIKKYIVKSMNEAIPLIKRELGDEALILSQKKIQGKDSLGAKKDMLEVSVAVDNSYRKNNISETLLKRKYNLSNNSFEKDYIEDNAFKKTANKGLNNNFQSSLKILQREVSDLKLILKNKDFIQTNNNEKFSGVFLELYLNLKGNGVSEDLAKKIIKNLQYQVDIDDLKEDELIKSKCFNLLATLIGNPSTINLKKNPKKIVVLVGPTGVGKTTTIAKLASYYRLIEDKRIALITIDSYRIGAEAQLRRYAELLDIPFYSVYDEQDLDERIKSLSDKDIIFVDTIGRKASDHTKLEEMNDLLSILPDYLTDIFLILSASTKSEDLYYIYDNYKVFKPNKLIISKIDETLSIGNIFNFKNKIDLPLAYFTIGQRVPEDIEIASPKKMARLLLKDPEIGELS